jgi:1-aminocyclopropane-1-carboxylate deaminase
MIHSSDIPDIRKACIQALDDPLLKQNKINMHVLRLDKIHAIVSGNKWFKLKYYLIEAARQARKGIITVGGYYSNHLIATAYASRQAGLLSIGIIRGEEPATYSSALKDLESYGMKLQFYSRPAYNDKNLISQLQQSYPDFLVVDEGGRGHLGIKGAEEILKVLPSLPYTHILCAVGTGTMMTGIINTILPGQCVIGIPVLKIGNQNNHEIFDYITNNSSSKNFSLQYDFHFGGYAKKNDELIRFINHLYHQHNIPTDFVYTGKLFYGTMKLVERGFFKAGADILVIHSGGLQGNRSLPENMLHFSY